MGKEESILVARQPHKSKTNLFGRNPLRVGVQDEEIKDEQAAANRFFA